MKMADQWIEAFRAGDYGDKGKFTAADLQVIASAYDPAKHEAPITVGHPEMNAPAYGWVEALKVEGDTLFAKARQVQPEFEAAVERGLFKKRSVALYPKFDATGTPYLRHIGFLGAMPPEVKGLADVKFSAQAEFREIEFQEKEKDMDQKTLMDSLREFFGGNPKVFTEQQFNEAIAAAKKPLEEKLALFGEMTPADKTKMADMQKEIDGYKSNMAETEKRKGAAVTMAEAVVNKLKGAKKWIPAFDAMKLPELFTELAKSETVVTFGEGDKAKKKTALELFGDFIGGIKQIVPEGEIYTAAKAAPKSNVVKFNETKGIALDQDSVVFADACNKRAEEKKITYGEAMKQLRAEGWEPVQGGAAAGAV